MTFTLHWPQITYLMMIILVLGINAAFQGQKRDSKFDFFTSFISSVFTLFILYKGGFFG